LEWFFSVRAKYHCVLGPVVQEYAKRSLKNWGRLNSKHLMDVWRVFAKDIRQFLMNFVVNKLMSMVFYFV
jgi:hypothetical protein